MTVSTTVFIMDISAVLLSSHFEEEAAEFHT